MTGELSSERIFVAFSRRVCLFARICCLYLICSRWSGFGLLAAFRLGGEGEDEEISEGWWQTFAWRNGGMDEWRGEEGEHDLWWLMLAFEIQEDAEGEPASWMRGEGELAGDTTSQAT